jgi:hypothetical protein
MATSTTPPAQPTAPTPIQPGDTAATSQTAIVADNGVHVVAETTAKLPVATPDITPVQVAAGLKFVVMVIVALGLHINSADQVTIIGASGFICVALIVGDALIRRGRAAALAVIGSQGVKNALEYRPKAGGTQA